MDDTCQPRARNANQMSSLARSGSSITIERRKVTARLQKLPLKGISLPEWSSSMDDLQLDQKNVLTSVYSMFGFDTLQKFHKGISKLLKYCYFKSLRADTISRPRRKGIYERRSLSKIRMSI